MKNSGRNFISGAAVFLMLPAAAVPAFSQETLAGAVSDLTDKNIPCKPMAVPHQELCSSSGQAYGSAA